MYFCLGLIVALFIVNTALNKKNEISLYYSYRASSADPLNYDLGVHHVTMRSVYSSLVSEYHIGRISPDIAIDWKSTVDFKKWSFLIDKTRRFSSGAYVSPEIVALSLNRMAYLMKSRNSKSGVLDHLIGFDEIDSPSVLITGITFDDNYIHLNFKISMPKLLNKIGFGLYAIVHPNDYHPVSGLWKNEKKVDSSGHYKIVSWIDDEMSIELKDEFKNKNRFEKINFFFENYDASKNYDLVAASSEANLPTGKYKFSANVVSRIRYIQFSSWNDPMSVFFEKSNRIKFMEYYYKKVEAGNLNITRSFFPLSIAGVSEMAPLNPSSNFKLEISPHKSTRSTFSFVSRNFTTEKNSFVKPVNHTNLLYESIYEFSGLNSLAVKELKNESFLKQKSLQLDITIDITGILLDDPEGDIKFMFLSKEGIQLPDEDGSIIEILNGGNFQIQEVNRKLWLQGIVWPVNHLSFGLWINSELNYNSAELNLDLFPIDFWWLKID